MPVYLSIGAGVMAATAVAVSIVRHRSAYAKGEILANMAMDPPPWELSSPDPFDDHGVPSFPPAPLRPPVTPPTPWSALEPVVELKAPGPGVLGRLRRRPLADLSTRGPSSKAPVRSTNGAASSKARPTGKAASPRTAGAKAATRAARPPGARQTGRSNGTSPAKRARPASTSAKK